MLKAMKDSDFTVRRSVAEALVEMGAAAADVVPDMAACLKIPIRKWHLQIIMALAAIGPGTPAPPPVIWWKLTTDKTVDVRGAAVYALGEIGLVDKTVVTAIVKALKDDDADVRKAAAGLGQARAAG